MLIIPALKIGYQNIPKVATTSLFEWFYDCIYADVPAGKRPKAILKRDVFLRQGRGDALATQVANTPAEVEPYLAHYRFALTRDPVRRFLSMYSNRVVFYRELARKDVFSPAIQAAGLAFNPDINLLVDRFDAYSALHPSIQNHSQSMMSFLGPDLGAFNRIADIAELPSVIDDIKRHFVANGLAELAANAPELARSQSGGPKLGLDVLNPYSFEKLLEMYREDYENIPTIDLAATKEAYRKARDEAFVALAVAVTSASEQLPALRAQVTSKRLESAKARAAKKAADGKPNAGAGKGGAGKAGAGQAVMDPAARQARQAASLAAGGAPAVAKKAGQWAARKALQQAGASPAKKAAGKAGKKAAGKAGAGAALDVTYLPCVQVEKARVALEPGKRGDTFAGFVLLNAVVAGSALVLRTPAGEQAVEWHLPSPKLVERFPENPAAAAARFRVTVAAAGECELVLRDASGNAQPLARFVAAPAQVAL